MELRVEELARRAAVSVDTVRFYQARGLLPPPRRQGRVALYGVDHLRRLDRIRELQSRGLTLAVIQRLVTGDLDAADEALVSAVSAATGSGQEDDGNDGDHAAPAELLTLDELAERSGIPVALLGAVEREGLLVPRRVDGEARYTPADLETAAAGLKLLEAGLPLPEILALAREHHAAMRSVAATAVSLFDEHVRKPIRTAGHPPDVAARRLVDAFNVLLPATTTLVAHHFRGLLLAAAQAHIEEVGEDAELAAIETQARVL